MAHGDIGVRDAPSDSCSYLEFMGIVGGRKRRRDRNGFDATVDDIGNCFIQCRFINRSDLPAVKHIPAADHVAVITQRGGDVGGPVTQRRKPRAGREAGSDDGCRTQLLALNDGISKVGRADHYSLNRRYIDPAFSHHPVKRLDNSLTHIAAGQCFMGAEDFHAVHQNRISMGTTNIYTDSHAADRLRLSREGQHLRQTR